MKRSTPSDQDGSRQTNRRRQQGPAARRDEAAGPQQAAAGRSSSGRAAGFMLGRAADSASRSSAAAQGTGQESLSITYPHPKNFAERLMFVLESRAAPETIWWEDSGRTVALHVDNLKQGDVLTRHFNGIKYKFFIRNFSRWGFRRNLSFTVPFGQFHYSNSLFQRDNPHLIKHMRMDSDVQDVFARHQASENQARQDAGGGGGGGPPAAFNANNNIGGNPSISSRDRQEATGQEVGSQQQSHGNQPPPAAMFNPVPPPLQPQAQQVDSLLGALLPGLMPAMLSAGMQAGGQPPSALSRPGAQQQDPNDSMLLQVLLELTQVYLNQPTLQSPYSDAIGAILRIVQVLGQQPQVSNVPSNQINRTQNHLEQIMQAAVAASAPGGNVQQQQAATNNAAQGSQPNMMTLLAQSLAQGAPPAMPSQDSFQYQDNRPQQQQQQLPTMQPPQLSDLLRQQQAPVPQAQQLGLPGDGSALSLVLQQLISGMSGGSPPQGGNQQNNNPNNGQGR